MSTPPLPNATPPRLPWEERDHLGLVEGMVQSVRLLVTNPSDAFARLRSDGDLTSPMLFGIVVSWVCMLFSQLWSVLISSSLGGAMGEMEGLEQFFGTPGLFQIVVGLVVWPVMFVVMAFVGAGVLHVCLLMVGAMDQSELGFEGTLKVYIYATVSWFALIVPLVGGLVASLWHLVLLVVGLAAVHRTSQGRALVAVLIPTIVCCLCVVGAGAVFGAFLIQLINEGGLP